MILDRLLIICSVPTGMTCFEHHCDRYASISSAISKPLVHVNNLLHVHNNTTARGRGGTVYAAVNGTMSRFLSRRQIKEMVVYKQTHKLLFPVSSFYLQFKQHLLVLTTTLFSTASAKLVLVLVRLCSFIGSLLFIRLLHQFVITYVP